MIWAGRQTDVPEADDFFTGTGFGMKPVVLGNPRAARWRSRRPAMSWPSSSASGPAATSRSTSSAPRATSSPRTRPPRPPPSSARASSPVRWRRRCWPGEIDLAVHSLKDLPTAMSEGLMVAAIPKRADARDVLITRGPELEPDRPPNWVTASGSLRRVVLGPELRYGAVIATGSARRDAQLRHVRNDLKTAPVRGNIETRIRKFREKNRMVRPCPRRRRPRPPQTRRHRSYRDQALLRADAPPPPARALSRHQRHILLSLPLAAG
ncbi:MAG: hypothetical protein WDO13_04080 [Verrucomicrobiota bacterium]